MWLVHRNSPASADTMVLNTVHNGLYTLRKKVVEPIIHFLYSILYFPFKDKTEIKSKKKKIVVIKFVSTEGSNSVFGSAVTLTRIREFLEAYEALQNSC
jgi:hypothetical protein